MPLYHLNHKEFSQLFLPFSRNSSTLTKILGFALTKSDADYIAAPEPRRSYSLRAQAETTPEVLTPRQEFMEKAKLLLQYKTNFPLEFSIFLKLDNEAKSYNFASSFEDAMADKLSDISQLPFSSSQQNILKESYLLSVVAYLAYISYRYKDVLIETNIPLEVIGTPLSEKLLSKGAYSTQKKNIHEIKSTEQNFSYFNPLTEAKEHLEQKNQYESKYAKDFLWTIDNSLLVRSWGHEEYVLDELKLSHSALLNAEEKVLKSDSFWKLASPEIFKIYQKYNYKDYGDPRRLKVPPELYQQFSTENEFNQFLKIILNQPEIEKKFYEDKNCDILFAFYQHSKNNSYHHNAYKISRELVEEKLKKLINDESFLEIASKSVYLEPYYPLIHKENLQKENIQNILAKNLSLRGDNRQDNLLELLITNFPDNKKIDYQFLHNFFTQSGTARKVEISFLSYYADKQAYQLMSQCFETLSAPEFSSLFILQPDFCMSAYKAVSVEKKKSNGINLLSHVFEAITKHPELLKNQNNIFRFMNELPQSKEFFDLESTQYQWVKLFNYHISDLTEARMNMLNKNKDVLLQALKTSPEFIKSYHWPLSHFDNNEYLKLISPVFLLKLASDKEPVRLALSNTGNKPLEEQKELFKTNALFYYFCGNTIKNDLQCSVNYAAAVLQNKETNSFGRNFSTNDIPKAIRDSHEFGVGLIEKLSHTYAKDIVPLIKPELWFNQKFILSLCKAMDEQQNAQILELLPPQVNKFLTSFSLKPGQYYDFMNNYMTRQNLQKQLSEGTPIATTHVRKNKI